MHKAKSTSDAFDMFGVLRQNYRCQSQLADQLQRIVRERARAAERLRAQREAVRRELLDELAYLHVYKRYSFEALQAEAEAAAAAASAERRAAAAVGGEAAAARRRPNVLAPLRLSDGPPAADPFHLKDIHRCADDSAYALRDTAWRRKQQQQQLPLQPPPPPPAFGAGATEQSATLRGLAAARKFPAIWKSRDKAFYEKKKEKLLAEWTSPAAAAAAAAVAGTSAPAERLEYFERAVAPMLSSSSSPQPPPLWQQRDEE